MNRYSRQCLVFALSLTLTGCVSKAFPLINPIGTSNNTAVNPTSKVLAFGTLRVRVSWPNRYFSKTIPLSTDAFELHVMDANDVIIKTALLRSGETSAELKLPPGNNYALKALAYRNFDTPNRELVAEAYQAALNIQPAKLTAAPLTLLPVYIPYIAALDYNVAKRGDIITIQGNNFGTSSVDVFFDGASQSVTPTSSTSISIQIPTAAFTGNLSVKSDGVNSQNNAFLWILNSLSIGAATNSIPAGCTLPLSATPSYFTQTAIPENAIAPAPIWESLNPDIANVTSGVLTGINPGTATVRAKLGIWTSNDLTITVTTPPPAPTLARFSRSDGMEVSVARPGDPVCLEGTGFVGTMLLDFNGATTSVTATESTKLWVTVPAGANTGFVSASVGGSQGISPKPLWILTADPSLTLSSKNTWDAPGPSEAYILHNQSLHIAINAPWAFKAGESEANYLPLPTPITHNGYLGVGCQFIDDTTTATFSAQTQNGDVYAWVQYPEAVIRQSNQLLFHIIPSWVETFAGSYKTYSDGVGTSAGLMEPKGIALFGNALYFTDQYRIRRIDLASRQVITIAGSSLPGTSDGIGVAASFKDPYGISFNSSGYAVIADQANNTLRQLTPSQQVSTMTLPGGTTLNYPTGVAYGADGFYFSEYGARRIQHLDNSGNLSLVAGSGLSASTDGLGATASFLNPTGIALAPDGTLYVAEDYRIRKIDTSGNVTTIAGGAGTGFADGQGTAAAFNQPKAIAIAPNNDLYITDYGNHAIRKIDTSGNVTTVAGSTVSGLSDGAGTGSNFTNPYGLVFGPDGALYVCDRFTYRIRRIFVP